MSPRRYQAGARAPHTRKPEVKLSVIIPAHNPNPGRLRAVLLGLRAQTLRTDSWHTVIVNNASDQWPDADFFASCTPANLTIVSQPTLGLSAARRAGFEAARGDVAVLVDDDNVLASDYLERVIAIFAQRACVGIIGGKSVPQFEIRPPEWAHEFFGLLALRDLGPTELISHGLRPDRSSRNRYPAFAPIGAGMALRREAWESWLMAARKRTSDLTDRRGLELSSAGDNDIVLCTMKAGWEVGYFPELALTHLVPAFRLAPDYLGRLNRGIQKSWIQVLRLHDANPWSPISSTGSWVRKTKAWFGHQAWRSPAARIRWQGACGHFDGLIDLHADDSTA